jgi:hypothetical protein
MNEMYEIYHHGSGSFRYVTMEESVRMALIRKRRLRLIYKWRHGLLHVNLPDHRDRAKLRILQHYQDTRDAPMLEEISRRFQARAAEAALG